MVILQQGANNVILTLTEKVTIANPYYLFALSSIQTNQTIYFMASDISSHKERYNKFVWTIKNEPDFEAGEFDLPIEGLYTYTAYQLSTPALTPPEGAIILEVGNVQYGYSEQNLTIYSLPNNQIKIYE
jgi:hypothetical protein